MTKETSFSELLGNNMLKTNDFDDITNEIDGLDEMTAEIVQKSNETIRLKRKPSRTFQKQRSQIYEPEFINPVDRIFDDYKDDITLFLTPHGEEQHKGLGLDLNSLTPSNLSTKNEIIQSKNTSPISNQIETIPDLIDITIPRETNDLQSRRGHSHRNSIELTGLSQQFGNVLNANLSPVQSNMMQYPTSPGNQNLMCYPTSPVHNPMINMIHGSPISNPMMVSHPSSPLNGNNNMMMPMPIPISIYNQSSMYYDPNNMMNMIPNSPALSTGMSDQFNQFSLSQPSSPCSSDMDKKDGSREKREYKCRQCGQPKSGHICSSIKTMMDSAVQHEMTPSNTSEWRILQVKSKWVS